MSMSYALLWLANLVNTPPAAGEVNIALVSDASLPAAPAPVAATLPASRAAFGNARRLWALPGPDATLRGLGHVVQEQVLKKVAGWQAVNNLELPRVGSALYRIARQIETGTAEAPTTARLNATWLVGTLVPLPVWLTTPLPEIVPPKVTVSLRLKASVPLLTTSPTIEPESPPFPSCSVPAVIIVPPL